MKAAAIVALAAILVTPGCMRSTQGLNDANSIARREFIARHLPGMAVVILKGDETRFAQEYGAAELAGDVPVQWAVHAARSAGGFRQPVAHARRADRRDSQAPVDFAPGSRWSYSNTNYTMLALIVERIAGKPYEDVLAERFFRPLNLPSMRQCASIPSGAGEARGYEWTNNTNVLSPPENMNWIRGDGGLCGSAADLARWTRLLSTGRVIAREAYEQMIAPTRLADGTIAEYGFALSLVRPDHAVKIAHNGAMRGFSASAAYYPESQITTVVLTNRGDVRTEAIERAISRRVIGEPEQDRTARQLPDSEKQRVQGTYNIGIRDVRVFERDGRLWFEMPQPGPSFRLRYVGNGRFIDDDDPDASALTFPDGTEPAPTLRFYMGAMHWYGRRVNHRP